MKLRFLIPAAILVFFSPQARSQVTYATSSHTVTVVVSTITLIQVSSGVVNLTISGANAIAGQDLMTVNDQGTSLLWGINSSLKKISVNTSLAAPIFTLKLTALNPTQGMAAPQVTLSTTPTDLLLNIGRSSGNCVLQYTAEALASQGTGSDSHTITLTVQNQ
jgi:hypothetical protein